MSGARASVWGGGRHFRPALPLWRSLAMYGVRQQNVPLRHKDAFEPKANEKKQI